MKAQLSWEFIATIFLFILSSAYFLFTIFKISPLIRHGIKTEAKRAIAYKISEILVSDTGEPADWAREYFGPSLETFRKPINFSSYSFVPNYSLLLLVNTQQLISQNKLDLNCNSLRFIDKNYNSIPYYLESDCNSQNTKIWVRVNLPSNENGTIYMYYYNSTLQSLSSAKEVFDFYDDFSSLSYTNERWYFENR